MNDYILNTSLAVGGLLFGHLVSRLWDRARPLVVPTGFKTVSKTSQNITISEELSLLTDQSWFMEDIEEGTCDLGSVSGSLSSAARFVASSDGIETWIREAKQSLEKAEEEREITEAIKQMIQWKALSDLIELGLLRKRIQIESKEYNSEPIIRIGKAENNEFVFVFENSFAKFGKKLDSQEWRAEKIQPFVDAVSFHDKEALLSVLAQLPDIAREQLDIHKRIKELATPEIDKNSRWVAYLSVINYGSSPMILWPQSKLTVVSKKGGGKFNVPGYLVRITKTSDDQDKQEELKGPLVIPPNSSEKIWMISLKTESEMDSGAILRAHYKNADSKAHISVSVGSRSIPWKIRTRSSTIMFIDESESGSEEH